MKTYMSGQLPATTALPRQNHDTHSVRSWVGPRAGLDMFKVKKKILPLLRFEPRNVQPLAYWFSKYQIYLINKSQFPFPSTHTYTVSLEFPSSEILELQPRNTL
jgi:hypothetical protein